MDINELLTLSTELASAYDQVDRMLKKMNRKSTGKAVFLILTTPRRNAIAVISKYKLATITPRFFPILVVGKITLRGSDAVASGIAEYLHYFEEFQTNKLLGIYGKNSSLRRRDYY